MVNAHTGEVVGQRPYSAWKILAAITAAVLLITAIITVIVLARHR